MRAILHGVVGFFERRRLARNGRLFGDASEKMSEVIRAQVAAILAEGQIHQIDLWEMPYTSRYIFGAYYAYSALFLRGTSDEFSYALCSYWFNQTAFNTYGTNKAQAALAFESAALIFSADHQDRGVRDGAMDALAAQKGLFARRLLAEYARLTTKKVRSAQ